MRVLSSLVLSILLLACFTYRVDAATISQKHEEIVYKTLLIAPEKKKNKKVVFTETYSKYSASIPEYMERSGLKSGKYLLLAIGDHKIPSVAKKSDEMIKYIAELKRGAKVKVYGKVRQFRVQPRGPVAGGFTPEYYIEVEKIETVEEAKDPKDRFEEAKKDRFNIDQGDDGGFNIDEGQNANDDRQEDFRDRRQPNSKYKHPIPPKFRR